MLLCVINLTAPVVTATSSCANLLVHQTKTSGIIQTGNNAYYSPNMDCRWNISSNAMLELVFLRMDTYDSNDYLLVYDGGSSSSPVIGTFSGTSLPAPITSSTNKLYAKFISDGSNHREGILARYQGKMHIYKITIKGVGEVGKRGGGGERRKA